MLKKVAQKRISIGSEPLMKRAKKGSVSVKP